jgi:ArsR family transcriptional regulator, arsenate/arsenite/antimonite-responsive transcriptional repressor / arsenate reductase (thioredoxin)
MNIDPLLPAVERAALHRALADEHRVRIVDALALGDRSPGELAELTSVGTNLLAFHLNVLEEAGLICRLHSQGDARRRYVTLANDLGGFLGDPPPLADPPEQVLFVCTANSARSQLAAHLWRARTGAAALSAGTEPADEVHPEALAAARRHGIDMAGAHPVALAALEVPVELVVSVCDRARETSPDLRAWVHWSIPDPVGHGEDAFDEVVRGLQARVERLARARELS